MIVVCRSYDRCMTIPVVERSKAWVSGRSLAGIKGSTQAGGMDVCLSDVSVVLSVSFCVVLLC
jgi:hypothetical protein